MERLYNRRLPPGPIAESWEISGHPNGSTLVDAGSWRGRSLPDVLATLREDLVGARAGWALKRNKFPLLIKLLDAQDRLSVQVHPPDEYALEHENGELGKTEMWYILHASPDAELILGVEPGLTREAFRRAIQDNALDRWLHHLPVTAGDAVFVPAGTIHAILDGLVAVEVQQNSDTTYRVYDWGRLGHDGQPRTLHVDKAIQVTNLQMIRPGPYRPVLVASGEGVTRYEISRSQYFVVEEVTMQAEAIYAGRTAGDTLEVWGVVEGESELIWEGPGRSARPISLPAVRFCLVPAAMGHFSVRARQPSTLLRVYLP